MTKVVDDHDEKDSIIVCMFHIKELFFHKTKKKKQISDCALFVY